MSFDINQLNDADYDDIQSFLPDYLDGLVAQFAQSPEGKVYAQNHPNFGSWMSKFTELAYCYEGFTLPQMTPLNVEVIMEDLFPRKITLSRPEDGEDAIPELIALWTFLKREYGFANADAIIDYLTSIQPKFINWMFDSARGGIAKNFIMAGMEAGFDMTTQEGLMAFQRVYNQQLLAGGLPSPPKPSKPKSNKGFQGADQAKKPKRKKK